MSEPRYRWSDLSARELERALRDLGDTLVYPATPDLASRVSAQLARETTSRPARLIDLPGRKIWLAAALILLAIGIALLLSPTTRTTIADRLGLPGVVIRWEETTRPPATPVGARMMLGRRVTLAEAREAVNFPLLVPERQGFAEPPEIYLTGEGDPMVSFVYPAGPGLPPATGDIGALLTQFPGRLDRGMIEKGLYATGDADASALESVSVGGERGFWLSGAPHTFFIVCDDGNECREERYRLAGNVLLWERNALTLRFESALSQDEALAIATSLRAVE